MSKKFFPYAHFDYTADDRAILDAEAGKTSIDDFTFGAATVEQTADEIEKSRSFRDIPPGDHLLKVVGFAKQPKIERKSATVNGRSVPFTTHSVIVQFCLADDPGAKITNWFLLPPNDPASMPAYLAASNGFMATALLQFLDRLGFPVVKGRPLPPEACRLGNWPGRLVWATIKMGKPFTNEATMETKEAKPEIKPFSFRPASSPPPSSIPAVGLGQVAANNHPAMPAGLDSI